MARLFMKALPILMLNISGHTDEIPRWAQEKKPVEITYCLGLGSSLPMGGLDDRWNQGLHIFGRLNFASSPILSVWAGVDYHRFPFEAGEETPGFKSINFSGDLKIKLAFSASGINPYFFGGAGIATVSKTDYFFYKPSDTSAVIQVLGDFPTKSYPLVELGGGADCKKFFFHVRYLNIFSDNTTVSYIPITLGVKF